MCWSERTGTSAIVTISINTNHQRKPSTQTKHNTHHYQHAHHGTSSFNARGQRQVGIQTRPVRSHATVVDSGIFRRDQSKNDGRIGAPEKRLLVRQQQASRSPCRHLFSILVESHPTRQARQGFCLWTSRSVWERPSQRPSVYRCSERIRPDHRVWCQQETGQYAQATAHVYVCENEAHGQEERQRQSSLPRPRRQSCRSP